MGIVSEVATAFQEILCRVSVQAGSESAFVRRFSRHSRLDGATFVQTLVFGWLANPQSSLQELAQVAGTCGVRITAQGLEQRFSASAVACLEMVLAATTRTALTCAAVPVPLLQRFAGVFVQDSSVIPLPAALQARWPGCGGGPAGNTTAALKIHVRFDVLRGQLEGPLLTTGKTHDRQTPLLPQDLPPGSLWIADLGFFKLEWFQEMTRRGIYWLSRLQAGTLVALAAEGPYIPVLSLIHQLQEPSAAPRSHRRSKQQRTGAAAAANEREIKVWIGKAARVPARLFLLPVPPDIAAQRREHLEYWAVRKLQKVSAERLALCDWTILVTNVPARKDAPSGNPVFLSASEAMVLYRTRWQIERLFRLWKEIGQIDNWRSAKLERIQCEVLAKMIAMVLQHWVILSSCWEFADRSLHHAARLISKHALHLASVLGQHKQLIKSLAIIGASLAHAGRIQKRRGAPANFQLLLAPPDTGYA